MKKKFLFLILSCISIQNVFCQISEGGTPISFSKNVISSAIPTIVMQSIDVQAVLQEDEKPKEKNTLSPFKFGLAIDVDIDLKKMGLKEELPNGDKLWLLKIHSPGAYSINLIYNDFKLASGSKLFVYNEEKTMVLGAFTPELSNNQYNEFATDLVQGNTIILEYYVPKDDPAYLNDDIIKISKVIHGYINTFSDEYNRGLGESASCNKDINCPLGSGWDNEKKAICLILYENNTSIGTGCLINNTNQDCTPYILTACHCYYDDKGILRNNPATNIFRFKYWKPSCDSGSPSNWNSITGATMIAHYAPTDFVLLKLNSSIPSNYAVYFAGWDRNTIPALTTTTIHHPKGDVMKISDDMQSPIAVSWQGSPTLSHWRVEFDHGIVQNGSSGAPLFNQNKRIVGQLHGNQRNMCYDFDNACHCAQTPIGEYGRFDMSWTGGGTSSTRLSDWLAPGLSSPPTTLNGTPPSNLPTIFSIFGNNQVDVNGGDYFYEVISACATPTTYFWEVTGMPSNCYRIVYNGSSETNINFYCSGTYSIGVTVSNQCGSAYLSKTVSTYRGLNSSPFTVYHNPVDDVLFIDIDHQAIFSKYANSVTTSRNITCEFKLYDITGILVAQTKTSGNKVQINVSSLPDGIYILHLYDGISNQPETKQIIVKH